MPERRPTARSAFQQSPGTAERRTENWHPYGDESYEEFVSSLLNIFGSDDEFRRMWAEGGGPAYNPLFLNGPGDGMLPRTVNAAWEGKSTSNPRVNVEPAYSFAQKGDIELPSLKPKRRAVK